MEPIETKSGLSALTRLAIANALRNGRSVKQVAKDYATQPCYVMFCANEHKIGFTVTGSPLAREQRHQIARRYDELKSLRGVAREYNVSTTTVKNYAAEFGVLIRHWAYHRMNEEVIGSNSREYHYFIGLFGADGNISRTTHALSIELKHDDRELLENVKAILGLTNLVVLKPPEKSRKQRGHGSARLTFSNDRLYRDLTFHGYEPAKSLTFSPPPLLNRNADFWRGMVDGDGGIYMDSGRTPRVKLYGTYHACSEFLKWALELPGINYKYRTARPVTGARICYAEITGWNDAGIVADALYGTAKAPAYLDRKREVALRLAAEARNIANISSMAVREFLRVQKIVCIRHISDATDIDRRTLHRWKGPPPNRAAFKTMKQFCERAKEITPVEGCNFCGR